VYPLPETGDEKDEVLEIIQRICPVVLSAAVLPKDDIGTSLRRMVGMMAVDKNMVMLSLFSLVLQNCLGLARRCAATVVTMDRVRKAALAEQPVSLPAVQTVLIIVRLALATESYIISEMTFRSREEVDAIAAAMTAAFQQTQERAADDLDQGTYMELISLHGTLVKYLADRGRVLPRVIPYNYATILPALRMAHRAYSSAERYRELIDENNVVHPAFMPAEGKMLAALDG
jgi:prophage DNA circulation protein